MTSLADQLYVEPPAHVPCPNCGTLWPRVRMDNPRLSRIHWVYPKLNPCRNCSVGDDFARKRRIDTLLMGAGFPAERMGYEFSERGVEVQPEGMPAENFQRWIMSQDERPLGILRENVEPMRQLYRWKPPAWVLLHGPVGTGKTTTMAAMARKLHHGDDMVRVYIDGDKPTKVEDPMNWDRTRPTAMHRRKIPPMRYVRLDHLIAEHEDRFKGNRSPVRALSRFKGVLFLDELGIHESPRPIEKDVVDHIIGERSDRDRCTVVATNCTLDDLRTLYGVRAYDRLRAATRVPLIGRSWRPDEEDEDDEPG